MFEYLKRLGFGLSEEEREQRRLYWASDEWFLEKDGLRIALLTPISEPKNQDNMFWTNCVVEPLVQDEEILAVYYRFQTDDIDRYKVRHLATGLIAEGAFPSGQYFDESKMSAALKNRRIAIRSLYCLQMTPLTVWEKYLIRRAAKKSAAQPT